MTEYVKCPECEVTDRMFFTGLFSAPVMVQEDGMPCWDLEWIENTGPGYYECDACGWKSTNEFTCDELEIVEVVK